MKTTVTTSSIRLPALLWLVLGTGSAHGQDLTSPAPSPIGVLSPEEFEKTCREIREADLTDEAVRNRFLEQFRRDRMLHEEYDREALARLQAARRAAGLDARPQQFGMCGTGALERGLAVLPPDPEMERRGQEAARAATRANTFLHRLGQQASFPKVLELLTDLYAKGDVSLRGGILRMLLIDQIHYQKTDYSELEDWLKEELRRMVPSDPLWHTVLFTLAELEPIKDRNLPFIENELFPRLKPGERSRFVENVSAFTEKGFEFLARQIVSPDREVRAAAFMAFSRCDHASNRGMQKKLRDLPAYQAMKADSPWVDRE